MKTIKTMIFIWLKIAEIMAIFLGILFFRAVGRIFVKTQSYLFQTLLGIEITVCIIMAITFIYIIIIQPFIKFNLKLADKILNKVE